MSILSKLLPPYPSLRSAEGVKHSDRWTRIHYGTLYEFVEETDRGVHIRESLAEIYENMETGEQAIIQRKDTRTEWHKNDDRREWPERVERARRDGYVWHADIRDGGLPPIHGAIIGPGATNLWRFADDEIEPPREVRSP